MKFICILLSIFISSIGFSQTSKDIDFIEKLTLKKINEYRKSKNKDELVMVDTISDDARKHSDKMVKSDKLYHAEVNYMCAENCGYIKIYKDFITYDEISDLIIKTWKESLLHNKALLYDCDKAGIGLSISKDSKFFFTYRILSSNEHISKNKRLVLDRL